MDNPLSLIDFSIEPHTRPPSTVPNAQQLFSTISNAHDTARTALAAAADRMKRFSDTQRSATPSFKVNDQILIRADHIHTTRPSKKLDNKNIGPFRITHVLGTHNYRLDLGQSRIHNVFHADRLLPYNAPHSFTGRPRPSRPPPETTNPTAFEVEQIVDSRHVHRKLSYFVKWKGYDNEDMRVAASDFDFDDSLVLDYARRHPIKPVHPRTRRLVAEESCITVMPHTATLNPV